MTRYQRQLLELICDKLEIDYTEQKQEAIKESNAFREETAARKAENDQRIAEMKKRHEKERAESGQRITDLLKPLEKSPWQILCEKEEAEAERLRSLSPDELADLRAAYISADQAVAVAWDAFCKANSDESISPIERDRIHNEWERLAQKAHDMRESLKIAQGVAQ